MEELIHWLPLIGIGMMRPLGVMLMLPVFSNAILGGTLIRNALALMAAFPVLPLLVGLELPNPVLSPLSYGLVVAEELGIGVLLGFSAAISFWALDMAGFIVDTMRGASMAGVFNPLLGAQSSPIGSLFSQLAVVLFMVLGGFHALLHSLFTSYQQLSPGQPWHWDNGFLPLLQLLWKQLYVQGIGFAMPAIVMMVLIDLALGLINRSVQQLNVFTLSMPIKSVIVLLMLIIGLPFSLSALNIRFVQFDGGLVRHLMSIL